MHAQNDVNNGNSAGKSAARYHPKVCHWTKVFYLKIKFNSGLVKSYHNTVDLEVLDKPTC